MSTQRPRLSPSAQSTLAQLDQLALKQAQLLMDMGVTVHAFADDGGGDDGTGGSEAGDRNSGPLRSADVLRGKAYARFFCYCIFYD